ncbi:MAG: hypothetical protein A4S14_13935 [Proteobacteria bacterium SG_bin9]|nr:MAG: hypothetical protein A4S14_13935 [Proteobacteria bacterium SG_bin9]
MTVTLRAAFIAWGIFIGGNTMRILSAIIVSGFLSGCAAPNIAGVLSPITSLTTAVSDAAALDQELADEFVKQSAVLYFLSNKRETCLDNGDGLTPAYTKHKQIQKKELGYLKLRLIELYKLEEYANSLADLENKRAERAARIDYYNRVAAVGTQLAGYMPLIAEEAKAVKATSDAITALVKLIDQNQTAYKIMEKAHAMQPEIEKMLDRLEDKFQIVSERTQLYVNAWRACTREKFLYIRDNMASTTKPVAILDLDASYMEFRTKYRSYLNRIPQVEKGAFKKIKEANKKMAEANTVEEFAANAEALAALVAQLVSTYETVKTTQKSLTGT